MPTLAVAKRRVVVTGLGVCSSLGTGLPRFREGLFAGRSGIAPIAAFDASALRSRIAGEVRDFDPAALLSAKIARRTARFTQLALAAAFEALDHAALPEGEGREGVAVVVGSGIGGFDMLEREHEVYMRAAPASTRRSPWR